MPWFCLADIFSLYRTNSRSNLIQSNVWTVIYDFNNIFFRFVKNICHLLIKGFKTTPC